MNLGLLFYMNSYKHPSILSKIRWRVALMEKGIALIDFENIDQMIQVHGKDRYRIYSNLLLLTRFKDYEGVGLNSRDANSKKAAATATTIFQDYYPEFLVCYQ